jgi:hypothetical protein
VNHFVFDSPDHVAHVVSEWRALFGWTAVLLAVTEALGASLAIREALFTTTRTTNASRRADIMA